jgi:epoxyqueuosine reductase
VCPPNRSEDRRHPPPPAGEGDEPWVELVWLLGCSDDELLAHLGRWYIPRRQPRYLRRNALVALGNVGDGRDRRVARAVGDALADPDPLVRAHAVWAAARLGRHDLAAGLAATESDAEVLTELTGAGLAG